MHTSQQTNFEGVWLSRYTYRSASRGIDVSDQHYLHVQQDGMTLTALSLPSSEGSRLRLDLDIEFPVASGVWHEETSPDGHYGGVSFQGLIQLVIDPDGRRMHGMWLGIGRRLTVNSGDWTLTAVSDGVVGR